MINRNDLTPRAKALLAEHQAQIQAKTSRLFAGLMVIQWIAAIIVAVVVSPQAWEGSASRIHLHLWLAVFLGGLITALPVALALARPTHVITRHVVAAGQMLMSALLIHL